MKRTIIDASQLELEDKVVTIKRVTKVPANLNLSYKFGRSDIFHFLLLIGLRGGEVEERKEA